MFAGRLYDSNLSSIRERSFDIQEGFQKVYMENLTLFCIQANCLMDFRAFLAAKICAMVEYVVHL